MKDVNNCIKQTVIFITGDQKDKVRIKMGIKAIKLLIKDAYIKGQISILKKDVRLKVNR